MNRESRAGNKTLLNQVLPLFYLGFVSVCLMYSPVPPYDPIRRSGEARPGTHLVAQMFTTVEDRRYTHFI